MGWATPCRMARVSGLIHSRGHLTRGGYHVQDDTEGAPGWGNRAAMMAALSSPVALALSLMIESMLATNARRGATSRPRSASSTTGARPATPPPGPRGRAQYIAAWLERRREPGHDWRQDFRRLDKHVLPTICDLVLTDVRTVHIADLVRKLRGVSASRAAGLVNGPRAQSGWPGRRAGGRRAPPGRPGWRVARGGGHGRRARRRDRARRGRSWAPGLAAGSIGHAYWPRCRGWPIENQRSFALLRASRRLPIGHRPLRGQ